ncbi:MEMO1 family protein [Candidatus Micrarchaeota archaeon]|nr:MEMO1 family protein [Candidatus Micrarchaeota archaeon]
MQIRRPVVAGSFYPEDVMMLKKEISGYLSAAKGRVEHKSSYGILCPHAGYMYSGHVAAYSYVSAIDDIKRAETIIVIGPNHTGIGGEISLSREKWSTPLGMLSVDDELVAMISDGIIKVDESAHVQEHSVEVQLPFIQYINPNAMLVPICMKDQSIKSAEHLAKKIIEAEDKSKRKLFIVASSDLSHYVPSDIGEKTDKFVLESVVKLDVNEFYDRLSESGASFCGYGSIATLMFYSKLRGGERAELLRFASSGEINANYSQVVDYAAITFVKSI